MSKSLHGTYLSGSTASGEPVAFAASGDYPPRPPQESYNMADLGVHGDAGEVYVRTLVMDVLLRLIPVQYYVMHAFVPPDTSPCTPIF